MQMVIVTSCQPFIQLHSQSELYRTVVVIWTVLKILPVLLCAISLLYYLISADNHNYH